MGSVTGEPRGSDGRGADLSRDVGLRRKARALVSPERSACWCARFCCESDWLLLSTWVWELEEGECCVGGFYSFWVRLRLVSIGIFFCWIESWVEEDCRCIGNFLNQSYTYLSNNVCVSLFVNIFHYTDEFKFTKIIHVPCERDPSRKLRISAR